MRIKFFQLAVVGAFISTAMNTYAVDITGAGATGFRY